MDELNQQIAAIDKRQRRIESKINYLTYVENAKASESIEMDEDLKTHVLNEQDLYCIARHIQYLVLKDFQGRPDINDACCQCKYAGKTCKLFCWGAFTKLASITGVSIQPFI